jgi:hypothetical protein
MNAKDAVVGDGATQFGPVLTELTSISVHQQRQAKERVERGLFEHPAGWPYSMFCRCVAIGLYSGN